MGQSDSERLAWMCGVVIAGGPHGEPVACGYDKGHQGAHSWAFLPTYRADSPHSSRHVAQREEYMRQAEAAARPRRKRKDGE